MVSTTQIQTDHEIVQASGVCDAPDCKQVAKYLLHIDEMHIQQQLCETHYMASKKFWKHEGYVLAYADQTTTT